MVATAQRSAGTVGDFVAGLLRLVLQVALLVAGLAVAAGLVLVACVLALLFGLRLLWARLTGRPVVVRFGGMGIDPADSWRRYRTWQQRTTRAPAPGAATDSAAPSPYSPPGALTQDVQDVEVKTPRS
jgi:hypothetical protein